MTFRRRVFPEVVQNLLTAITRGVAAEAHPFPPPDDDGPNYRHYLQHGPVAGVVAVYGSRNGEPYQFRKDTDYKLTDAHTLTWQTGAELPDTGTLVQVSYYPRAAQPVLTDLYTGSVVRTLAESVALEMARLYAQLQVVYDSGFIDTATGRSLDNVVALLGITRVTGGRAVGEVEFTRAPGSPGAITIPAGTRITNADGSIEYATTDSVALAVGQTVSRVTARDLEQNDPLPADSLTVLPVPIAGIARVTNPAPTAIATQTETDAQLRERAKSFLHGSERATLGALSQAVTRQGISADITEDTTTPGRVTITPHVDTLPPELEQRLRQAIRDARPAGVLVELAGGEAPKRVDLALRLQTTPGLVEQDLHAIQDGVRERVADYFAGLPAREAGSVNRLVGLILSDARIVDVRLLSATLGDGSNVLDRDAGLIAISGFPTVLGTLSISDPGLPTRLNVLVTFPTMPNPPDRAAIEVALGNTLAYLNTLNAAELPPEAPPAAQARRNLSYGKLLYTVPLPAAGTFAGQSAGSLETYDTGAASGTPPALPSETTIGPYTVKFVFSATSGVSQVLAKASDPPYHLTPFERLALSGVEVKARP